MSVRWHALPAGKKRVSRLDAAVAAADELAAQAAPSPARDRLLDLAQICRGYAQLLRESAREAKLEPARMKALADALARARRVAAGLPEKKG